MDVAIIFGSGMCAAVGIIWAIVWLQDRHDQRMHAERLADIKNAPQTLSDRYNSMWKWNRPGGSGD